MRKKRSYKNDLSMFCFGLFSKSGAVGPLMRCKTHLSLVKIFLICFFFLSGGCFGVDGPSLFHFFFCIGYCYLFIYFF